MVSSNYFYNNNKIWKQLNGFKYSYLILIIFKQIYLPLKYTLTQSMFGWLLGFYCTSTFAGYSMPNPFLCE